MYVENGQENSVYNLVVNRRVDGNDSPDFVMRYEFIDQDILNYSQTEEERFNGKIDAFSFESFLSSLGESSKGGTPEPCYDDIGPDPNTNNNNTTSSGNGASSGNNGGSGYNSGATTTSGSTGWATAGSVGYTGAQSGGGKKKGSVEVGQGCFCAPKTKTQKSSAAKGDDCPKGEMLIAINVVEDHVHLIDEENNPCLNEIIKKLQKKDLQKLTVPDIGGLSGTGHLAQGILDLFDKSGNYDLTIKVEEAGSDGNRNPRNASTLKRKGANEWIVTIDDDYARKATKLALARTIIHESLHAFLDYTLKNNRSSDVSILLRDYYNKFGDRNMTEHTFMTQYVEAIGHSLSVWDNNSHSKSYYDDLAWSGGMLGTEAFNKLSATKKTSIENANHAEGSAAHKATRSALGIKCN